MEANQVYTNKFVHNSVIIGGSRDIPPDAVINAETTFLRIVEKYKSIGDKGLRPDQCSYIHLISAWTLDIKARTKRKDQRWRSITCMK